MKDIEYGKKKEYDHNDWHTSMYKHTNKKREFFDRFLAEAPDLEEKRVREILPWLVAMQNGVGVPYLLPFLRQKLDHTADSKLRDLWAAACLKSKVSLILTHTTPFTFKKWEHHTAWKLLPLQDRSWVLRLGITKERFLYISMPSFCRKHQNWSTS